MHHLVREHLSNLGRTESGATVKRVSLGIVEPRDGGRVEVEHGIAECDRIGKQPEQVIRCCNCLEPTWRESPLELPSQIILDLFRRLQSVARRVAVLEAGCAFDVDPETINPPGELGLGLTLCGSGDQRNKAERRYADSRKRSRQFHREGASSTCGSSPHPAQPVGAVTKRVAGLPPISTRARSSR